jgi:hypothetical protein
MRLAALLTVLALAACGGGPSTAAPGMDAGTTAGSAPPTSTSGAPDTTGVVTTTDPRVSEAAPDDAVVVFIAAVEETLTGTSYEGAALADPDVFVATGRLFCDQLDAGDDIDTVLARYLTELAGGVDAAGDDELVLAGAVLGAATVSLCLDHAAAVG